MIENIILGIIPAIHYFVLYYIAKKKKLLANMKKIYALQYLDWTFVPFNFLFAYMLNIDIYLFISLIIGVLGSYFMHEQWRRMKNKPTESKFFANNKNFTIQGKIHMIFTAFEIMLVAYVFLFAEKSFIFLLSMIPLLIYFLGYLYVLLFIRKLRLKDKIESPYIIACIIAIVLRMLL